MASTKAGGTAKNLRDSNPKYLGTKLYDGQKANVGAVIVRQRGTRIMPGRNVRVGKDHTLFAIKAGVVKFRTQRHTRFSGHGSIKRVVDVVPA
jgi:large subunit ribosomal protein L27